MLINIVVGLTTFTVGALFGGKFVGLAETDLLAVEQRIKVFITSELAKLKL